MDRADYMILALICAHATLIRFGAAADAVISRQWIGAVIHLGVCGISAFFFVKCIREALSA